MPAASSRIAVVISSSDEIEVLDRLLRATQRVIRYFDLPASVYVLDAGARQETVQLARALGATPVRQRAQGHGALIKTALEATHGDYIVTLHGDGLHPPALLPHMFAMRDQADLVIASRYVPQGFARMPRWRMALSRLLNAWFRRMLGLPFRDLSSSYRLYRRDLLKAIAPSMSTDAVSGLFEATLDATEEAIYNSLLKATDTSGGGRTIRALPIDDLTRLLKKYGR